MNNETKQYFRTEINNLDNQCNLINEIIFDDYLQDDNEFMQISDLIDQLQQAITNYQEFNNYI
jgi:FAD synthase